MDYSQDNVWLSAEDLSGDEKLIESSKQEFFNLPVLNDLADDKGLEEDAPKSSRRDFLKYLGFSVGAATVAAGCEMPVRRAIPYTQKPDAIVPGVATYYASTFHKGGDFTPVLVKTREGRPIKVEGNKLSTLSEGSTTARTQASVLELYDTSRYQSPMKSNGNGGFDAISWEDLDKEILSGLSSGANVAVLQNTNLSTATQGAIAKFKEKYPNTTVYTYDPISSSALVETHERISGLRGVPNYDFSQADTIISLGADFLGTWLAPGIFSSQFAKNRKLTKGNKKMSRLVVAEGHFSITGSNADDRFQIRPSEQGALIAEIYLALGGNYSSTGASAEVKDIAKKLADELSHSASGLLVSDSNNKTEQEIVAKINMMIGAYGKSIKPGALFVRTGKDSEIKMLSDQVKQGRVDALFVLGDANPLYDSPFFNDLEEALTNIKLSVGLNYLPTETSVKCKYIAPVDHYLEEWSDVQASTEDYGIVQPAIQRLFDTRSPITSFLTWGGAPVTDDRPELEFLKTWSAEQVFSNVSGFASVENIWTATLHDGVCKLNYTGEFSDFDFAGGNITKPSTAELEIKFYENVGIGNGSYANNPWLQELPDPITRVVWDNILQVPIKWDAADDKFVVKNDFSEDGLYAEVSKGESKEKLPVVRQFGQQDNTISTALGYGRKHSGKVANGIGKNLYPWLTADADGNLQYFLTDVTLSGRVGKDEKFASVQHHHTYGITGEVPSGEVQNVDERKLMTVRIGDKMNFQGGITKRTIIRHATLDHLDEAVDHLKHEREHHQYLNDQTLYPSYDHLYKNGHHWGMAIDLTTCTGCGACAVACMAENNVPVVGKNEVHRHHEMSWLRIDRYYYGEANNPSVVYQPMLCQHCDNAPCENVCPVNATNHSSEGLNQMTYNRCIGTRYCANNCPYKVRRFNWLDYTTADTFGKNENKLKGEPGEEPYYASNITRMVLNPDVMVRSRGVIEKCSFCVQRIQEGKLTAKKERRPLQDGDIQPACQSACPTEAIVFGDLNDQNSEVTKLTKEDRSYIVLEETNVRSSINYQMKVLNKKYGNLVKPAMHDDAH